MTKMTEKTKRCNLRCFFQSWGLGKGVCVCVYEQQQYKNNKFLAVDVRPLSLLSFHHEVLTGSKNCFVVLVLVKGCFSV